MHCTFLILCSFGESVTFGAGENYSELSDVVPWKSEVCLPRRGHLQCFQEEQGFGTRSASMSELVAFLAYSWYIGIECTHNSAAIDLSPLKCTGL